MPHSQRDRARRFDVVLVNEQTLVIFHYVDDF